MLALVRRTGTEFGIAVVVASHLLGEIERVCNHLVAIEAGRDRLADPEGHDPASVHQAPSPQPAAVHRDGHDRQAERPVEAGEARPQRRSLARPHPRPFRIDDHRPARGDGFPAASDQGAQRLRARGPFDRDHPVLDRQEAEERDVGELLLHHDHRERGEAHHLHGFEHRLVLDRDQVRPGRDGPRDPEADAEHIRREPMMEIGPA